MNPIRRIRRFAVVLAGLAAGLVAFATPAFAREPIPGDVRVGGAPTVARPAAIPGTEFRPSAPLPAPVRTVTHTVVVSGMPGWQIALIAVGAALLAAAVAILADRAWTARRPAIRTAA
jgi:hypothetical protein